MPISQEEKTRADGAVSTAISAFIDRMQAVPLPSRMSRLVAGAFCASVAGGSPASADVLDGTGQAGFDTLIPQATQAGHADTVNITIGGGAGSVILNQNLVLPGAAQSLQLNFISSVGAPAGSARFNVDGGAQLSIDSTAGVTFQGNGRFNVGFGSSGGQGSVLLSGGAVLLDNNGGYSGLNLGYQGVGTITQTAGSFTGTALPFRSGSPAGPVRTT